MIFFLHTFKYLILSSLSQNRECPWTRNIIIRQNKDKPISLFCLKTCMHLRKKIKNIHRDKSLRKSENNSEIEEFTYFTINCVSTVKTFRLFCLLLHKWPWPERHVYVPVVPTMLWFFRRCQNFFDLFKRVSSYFSTLQKIVVDHKANIFD